MKKLFLSLIIFGQIYSQGLLEQIENGDKTAFAQVSVAGQNILNFLQNQSNGAYTTGKANEITDAQKAAESAKLLDNDFFTNLAIPDPTTDTTSQYSKGKWTLTYTQGQTNAITGGLMNLLTKLIKTTSIAAKKLSKPTPNFEKRPVGNSIVPKKINSSTALGSYQKFTATSGMYNQYTQYYYAWQMGPQLAALAAFLVWITEATFADYANNMLVAAHQAFAMHNQVFTGNNSNLCNVGTDLTQLTNDQLLSLSNESLTCFINNVWDIFVNATQDTTNFAPPAIIHFVGDFTNAQIFWYLDTSHPAPQSAIEWNPDLTKPGSTIPVPPGITLFHLLGNQCTGYGGWQFIQVGPSDLNMLSLYNQIIPNTTYLVLPVPMYNTQIDYQSVNYTSTESLQNQLDNLPNSQQVKAAINNQSIADLMQSNINTLAAYNNCTTTHPNYGFF